MKASETSQPIDALELETLLELQSTILGELVLRDDHRGVIDHVCRLAEQVSVGSVASVMLLDNDGHLRAYAAPSAPKELLGALDGLAPTVSAGSCANVVIGGEPVYVNDAQHDPRWEDLKDLTKKYAINACWSMPILGEHGRVIGAFALTGNQPPQHECLSQRLLRMCAYLVGLILERHREREHANRLAQQHYLQSQISEQTSNGLVFIDKSGVVTWVNKAFASITGRPIDKCHGLPVSSLFDFTNHRDTEAGLLRAMAQQQSYRFELPHLKDQGQKACLRCEARPLEGDSGAIVGYVLILVDITEERRTQRALSLAADVFHSALNDILVSDPNGIILDVNPAFCTTTGYERDELIGQHTRILRTDAEDPRRYEELWSSLARNGHWSGEIRNRKKDGTDYPKLLNISAVYDSEGELLYHVSTSNDISLLKEHEEALRYLAHHDALTGLPNRLKLDIHLADAIARASQEDTVLAVGILDLDDFKLFNDTYGHEAGDRLLKGFAHRLSSSVRPDDLVVRLGGDEFVVVIEHLRSWDEAEATFQRLRQMLDHPITLENISDAHIGASMGVSLFRANDTGSESLLRNADIALYHAKAEKREGISRFRIFEHSLLQGGIQRVNSTVDYASLIDTNLVVYYQPIMNLRDGTIRRIEALARMSYDGRILPPGEFLTSLGPGDLRRLNRAVCDLALGQLHRWSEDHGITDMSVSVNFTPEDLLDPALPTDIKRLLDKHHIEPDRLIIEVTESGEFLSYSKVSERFRALKELGLRIALDDLGTADASLLRLKELPFDEVKLDQAFLRGIERRPRDLLFVDSIRRLSSALGVDLVIEGVESQGVLEALNGIGITFVQGYVIARPGEPQSILAIVQAPPTPTVGLPHLTSWLSSYAVRLNVRESEILIGDWRKRYDPSIVADVTRCPLVDAFARDVRVHELHVAEHKLLAKLISASDPETAQRADAEMKVVTVALDELVESLIQDEADAIDHRP